jgi:hypothetical protein
LKKKDDRVPSYCFEITKGVNPRKGLERDREAKGLNTFGKIIESAERRKLCPEIKPV